MPSGIDPTKPVTGQPASKADLRANLQAAKTELEHGGFFSRAGAGAVERTTQDRLRESHISAADFGAVGDGATDNSAALIAMRDYMRADTSKVYRVFFPPGEYRYSNNRWLFGVPSIIIDAYGASFLCTASTGWHVNDGPLNVYEPFNDSGDSPLSPASTFVTGDRFDTAAAGDVTITMTTSGDAANYSVGDRVLVHGYDQQGDNNYPFNMRYFEYKTIESVNGGADTVTFTKPLIYDYDDRWFDTTRAGFFASTVVYGKPRILSLERPNYTHPKYLRFVAPNSSEAVIASTCRETM